MLIMFKVFKNTYSVSVFFLHEDDVSKYGRLLIFLEECVSKPGRCLMFTNLKIVLCFKTYKKAHNYEPVVPNLEFISSF
jgi:hypothetical protein